MKPTSIRQFRGQISRIGAPLFHGWIGKRQLKVSLDRTANIRRGDILMFSTLRNECWRLPYFFDYYRKLGVRHFLLVDNGSTDGLLDYLKSQPDCSCWYTEASYKDSNFGVYWMNALLGKYGANHWCLTCDPDEYLVYPHIEERNLHELTEFLANENRGHLFCLMLDMYGRVPVREAHCAAGQNPLEITPYFDSTGYVQNINTFHHDVYVQGGVRRRVFFRDNPRKAPALNKTPLVYWKRHYAYVSSTHVLSLLKLNRPHKKDHLCTTGCLLHFKFLSAIVGKASEELQRKQHYANSAEYRTYHQVFGSGDDSLFCEISTPYKNSAALIDQGLMNLGQWF